MKPDYKLKKKEWAKRRDAMIKLALKGIPLAEIARMNKISRQRVHSVMRKYAGKFF